MVADPAFAAYRWPRAKTVQQVALCPLGTAVEIAVRVSCPVHGVGGRDTGGAGDEEVRVTVEAERERYRTWSRGGHHRRRGGATQAVQWEDVQYPLGLGRDDDVSPVRCERHLRGCRQE